MTLTIEELLAQLNACPVVFDATADHKHGVTIVPKIAAMPVPLFEALKAHLVKSA